MGHILCVGVGTGLNNWLQVCGDITIVSGIIKSIPLISGNYVCNPTDELLLQHKNKTNRESLDHVHSCFRATQSVNKLVYGCYNCNMDVKLETKIAIQNPNQCWCYDSKVIYVNDFLYSTSIASDLFKLEGCVSDLLYSKSPTSSASSYAQANSIQRNV